MNNECFQQTTIGKLEIVSAESVMPLFKVQAWRGASSGFYGEDILLSALEIPLACHLLRNQSG